MIKRFVLLMLWASLAVALTGCVAASPSGEAAAPGETAAEATAEATAEPITEPTAESAEEAAAEATSALAALAPTPTSEAAVPAEPTATTAPTDWSTVATLEGDYVILGNPAAPIRLVDYSDFM